MSIRTATLNGVATIEIARPEKKNAITGAMYKAMADALDAAKGDKAVRAVLITGRRASSPRATTSRTSCSGRRARTVAGAGVHEGADGLRQAGRRRGHRRGVGVGTTMLLHCDFVYVSDEARLAMPFVSLGLVPEFASSLIVPQCGTRGPRRSCCSAIRSAAPMRWRWASPMPCCRRPRSRPHARRIAERFNALPPGAMRETKRLMRRLSGRGRGGGDRRRVRVSSRRGCRVPRPRRRSVPSSRSASPISPEF